MSDDEHLSGSDAEEPKKKKSKPKKEKKEKKERKAKKKSDGPKRAKSAYIFYSTEQRPILKEAEPSLEFGELNKRLGEQWNNLDADEKKKYEEMSAADKKRFEDEGGVTKSKGKKRKQEGPKRALSAFMFFAQEWRPKLAEDNPDAGFGDLGKLVGEKWKELTASEKKPYDKLNKEDKDRYAKELKEYEDEHGPIPKKAKKKPAGKAKGKKKAKKNSDGDDDDAGDDAGDDD